MRQISDRRIRQAKRLLLEIYSLIPEFECRDNCYECCGCHTWTYIEWKLITDWLRERGMEERFAKSVFDYCPYLENGKCAIYEVRPFVCRIYGVSESLKCPYVKAEKYLSREITDKLHEAVKRISQDLIKHRRVTEETRQLVSELKRQIN